MQQSLHLGVSCCRIVCCATASSFQRPPWDFEIVSPLLQESNFHTLRELHAGVAAGGAARYPRLVTEAASRPARLTAAALSDGSCWAYKHWCSVFLPQMFLLRNGGKLLVSRSSKARFRFKAQMSNKQRSIIVLKLPQSQNMNLHFWSV